MKKGFGFIFGFLFSLEVSFAQLSTHRLGLESQYGWIIPHNQELKDLASTHPISIGVSSQWMQNSRKNWEACNCFHYLGLGLSVTDFQNPQELGQAWSLTGSFEPFLFRGDKFSISLASGIGVSYLTKVYDPLANPRNTFFSAPISFLLFVTPKFTFDFSRNWAVQTSFSYNHISNGGQRQPNRGMNFPMLGLGVLYYTRKIDLPEFEKQQLPTRWFFYSDLGINSRKTTDGTRKPNFTLAAGTYRKLSGIIGMGGGMEVAKDFSLPVEDSRMEALIPAVFLENHFLFGRFDFSQRFAAYLSKPLGYQENHAFYQRYTLSYLLGKNVQLGAGLKAHGHVAEYLDFRVGWRF